MSCDVAISVRHLRKVFRTYERPQDRLKQAMFNGLRTYYKEFIALNDVNLSVHKGETVGIVGRNGSGKSTLLQIIAGTLPPTQGEVSVNGRVAALLELGSGFNPEFTGRENVYLNGSILGLSRTEVDAVSDDIERFAEIGSFIDQPVKTYSSGMVVRLAFAVQAMVPKEILIVDEALAVGDELFQKKCFNKIDEFKQQGGTILFVSHSGGTVIELCDRALFLDAGHPLIVGPSKKVVNLYQKLIYAPDDQIDSIRNTIRQISNTDEARESTMQEERGSTADKAHLPQSKKDQLEDFDPNLIAKDTLHYESQGAEIFDCMITNLLGQQVNILVPGRPYIWKYKVRFLSESEDVRFGMLIKTLSGFDLAGYVTAVKGRGIDRVNAGEVKQVEFKFTPRFNKGTYFLNSGVLASYRGEDVYLDRVIDSGVFKIPLNNDALSTSVIDTEAVGEATSLTVEQGDHFTHQGVLVIE